MIPLVYLELLCAAMARQQVERRAAEIDWKRMPPTHRLPQSWYDDTDNPFEPDEEAKS